MARSSVLKTAAGVRRNFDDGKFVLKIRKKQNFSFPRVKLATILHFMHLKKLSCIRIFKT